MRRVTCAARAAAAMSREPPPGEEEAPGGEGGGDGEGKARAGEDGCYLALCARPVHFEKANPVNCVFFDEANKQVGAAAAGAAGGGRAPSPPPDRPQGGVVVVFVDRRRLVASGRRPTRGLCEGGPLPCVCAQPPACLCWASEQRERPAGARAPPPRLAGLCRLGSRLRACFLSLSRRCSVASLRRGIWRLSCLGLVSYPPLGC